MAGPFGLSELPETFGPAEGCSISIRRRNGTVYISNILSNYGKERCIRCIVSWIQTANFTLDISLFMIMHRNIVDALIERRMRGVRIRLVIYRLMVYCKKGEKHIRYIDEMREHGITIRWVNQLIKAAPFYRMMLIDVTDPTESTVRHQNDPAVIVGEQTDSNKGNFNITADVRNVMIFKGPSSRVFDWKVKFDSFWNSACEGPP